MSNGIIQLSPNLPKNPVDHKKTEEECPLVVSFVLHSDIVSLFQSMKREMKLFLVSLDALVTLCQSHTFILSLNPSEILSSFLS